MAAECFEGASGTGRRGEQAGDVVQVLIGFRQMRIDTRGILDKNDLAGLIGFVVPGVVPPDCALGDDLVFVVHIRNELHGLDGAWGVQGHGLVVGFDQLAAVGPDDIHHIAIGIASYAEAHTIPGQLRRLLQLLTDLDKLVPGLGKRDLGSLENIQAGDQRRGAHRLGDGVGLALVHDLREDRKEPAWHALHLLYQVSHLQQVSLGAIER